MCVCVCDSIHAVRARVILFCVVVTNLFLFFLNFSLSDSPVILSLVNGKSWHPPPLLQFLNWQQKTTFVAKTHLSLFFFHFTDFSLEFRGSRISISSLFARGVYIYTHTHTHTRARTIYFERVHNGAELFRERVLFLYNWAGKASSLLLARAG